MIEKGAADLAVIILTHNEALHIARAIAAVRPCAREIFVIDSGSSDGTVEIAEGLGATVLHNPWVNYSVQFTWGLDNAPITSSWVMRLDADEVVGADLADEINETLPQLPAEVSGLNVDRRHIFMGRWIRHGGRFPLRLLRIWRRGQATIEDRWMDEHMVLRGGQVRTLRGAFSDINLKDLSFFTAKHNSYATREAVDVLIQRYDLASGGHMEGALASAQAEGRRKVKVSIYNRLPLWAGPALYFLYRYFLRFGFLDGKPGLIYHVLQGFWYRFLAAAKVVEFDRALAPLVSAEARRARLQALSGVALVADPAPEEVS